MMTNIYRVIMFLAAVLLVQTTTAQALKIGSSLSVDLNAMIVNSDLHKSEETGKYKLTILDFWSHFCSSCLKSMPKINQLQEQFGNSIQIIFVNKETDIQNKKMFTTKPWLTQPKTKMIAGDTLLHQLFDVKGMPHIVWLDSNLTVQHITEGQDLNESNILKFIESDSLEMNVKVKTAYIPSLFDERYRKDLIAYSYLAKAQYEKRIGSNKEKGHLATDVSWSNISVELLFKNAYEHVYKRSFNRLWELSVIGENIDRYFQKPGKGEEYRYDYDLRVPKEKVSKKFQFMIEDLERYFPIKSSIDTVTIPAYVLLRSSDKDLLKTKGGTEAFSFRGLSRFPRGGETELEDHRILKNKPYQFFSNAIKGLVETGTETPFVDLVDYQGNVDVVFDALTFDFFTLEGLLEELKKYGLKLEMRNMPVERLVLKEVK
ncbi:TlpA family protein disulfide reductase [Sphingobacterium sp. IITKGP-BTPF85]|uniref:TlpA family protein disulfide reductase n=1 Tax=Sphingobacterium sp. IITKGP-BTPF85 TaxID=1338009 RepID=UPI00038A2A3F|nr:thioredoxin-like domain-containing protein [Sphingobacterium sp. IITKGP-BTPF85]